MEAGARLHEAVTAARDDQYLTARVPLQPAAASAVHVPSSPSGFGIGAIVIAPLVYDAVQADNTSVCAGQSCFDVSMLERYDQARWVEAFARALVREDSDDVAQDAWLAAIQHPPAPAASPRPWFAAVIRNLRRMRFRSASRRRAREDASATNDKVPTPAELTHRMEMQRRLASAVLALEEPQRSTIVLVFYEGLSPADVARHQGVPATTVRSPMRSPRKSSPSSLPSPATITRRTRVFIPAPAPS